MKHSPGDRIKVVTKDKEIEGILMPSLDSDEKHTLILKLDNGYNIGIGNNKIKKIEILEKYKGKKGSKEKIKHNTKLPTVSILSTGGTISSKIDYRTGGVYADYTAEDFLRMCPELGDIANLNAKKIMSVMSEDTLSKDWIKLANEIKKEVKKGVDGIVVTQGTDTFHFITAVLSFMLEEINIPIVFTGSQRSIDRGSSDAFMNLICAVKAAAHFDCAEVMSCMHGSVNDDYCLLIRGTKVRKMHTSRRDAFRPINEEAFAKVHLKNDFGFGTEDRLSKYGIELINKNYKKVNRDKKTEIKVSAKFDSNVALVYVYPEMNPEIIDFYLKKKVLKELLLQQLHLVM